jgi:putative chitinase
MELLVQPPLPGKQNTTFNTMNLLTSVFQMFSGLFNKTPTTPVTTSVAPEVVSALAPEPTPDPAPEVSALLTATQLGEITSALTSANLTLYAQCLSDACTQFGITNPVVLAMFLGQIMHESGGGIWLTELASGEEYQGRADLGNTAPGSGVKYKGRGFIQITGLFNYEAVTKALGHDFVNNPEDLAQPQWAALSAAWYWNSHGLTGTAQPGTLDAFVACTKVINGGTNGEADREMYWGKAKTALGVK